MLGRKSRDKILKEQLNHILNRIDKNQIKKIILFGSLAKGRIGLTSDIDLIIIKNTRKPFLKRLEEMYQKIQPMVGVDLLVYTPEEFLVMQKTNNFIQRVLREGKVLYEA
ncbi:MAG: nucleotidyltransferase domain-containing protein [Candidatus Omnitrophica bacterium]|nr:nucleotidyltransferase domain-containing protein [Candidatus Omnitrophota bacterium]